MIHGDLRMLTMRAILPFSLQKGGHVDISRFNPDFDFRDQSCQVAAGQMQELQTGCAEATGILSSFAAVLRNILPAEHIGQVRELLGPTAPG